MCDPVVVRYYSCPPIALVLPIPLAFGVCRCHITVYDCVQLNIGCNDLLTVFSCRPDEPVSGALSCSTVIRQNSPSLVNNQRGEHSATKAMDQEVSADWLRLRLDQTKLA